MIGFYVHHVGQGHLRNAACIAAALGQESTGLSSCARPPGWPGEWIELDRDDRGATVRDPTAQGRFHWVPLHDEGLAGRMATIARWIDAARPAALVVDVSVEIAAFARLMGVPVIVMALPGDRSDPAHRLAFDLADTVLAAWPEGFPGMDRDLSAYSGRLRHVGGLTPNADRSPARPLGRPGRRVLMVQGSGGTAVTGDDVAAAAAATPGWTWQRIGPGAWCDDPWPALCSADVVVTHAGLGAVADVAAAARPAVVLSEDRPHGEQHVTARSLAAAGLAVTSQRWPEARAWPDLLARAVETGGREWHRWRTTGAALRAAEIIEARADAGTAG